MKIRLIHNEKHKLMPRTSPSFVAFLQKKRGQMQPEDQGC